MLFMLSNPSFFYYISRGYHSIFLIHAHAHTYTHTALLLPFTVPAAAGTFSWTWLAGSDRTCLLPEPFQSRGTGAPCNPWNQETQPPSNTFFLMCFNLQHKCILRIHQVESPFLVTNGGRNLSIPLPWVITFELILCNPRRKILRQEDTNIKNAWTSNNIVGMFSFWYRLWSWQPCL